MLTAFIYAIKHISFIDIYTDKLYGGDGLWNKILQGSLN